MTNRQIYKQIAAILGHRCYDGKKFLNTSRVGPEHLKVIQKRLLVLLEKLDYERSFMDFPHLEPHAPASPAPMDLTAVTTELNQLASSLFSGSEWEMPSIAPRRP